MKVYIAGPYQHGDHALNVRGALEAADEVRKMGHLPFVPHLTHFWHYAFPHERQYWLDMGLEWVLACDVVLRLPGESQGADDEVDLALEHGIPVFYLSESLRFIQNPTAKSQNAPKLRSIFPDLLKLLWRST